MRWTQANHHLKVQTTFGQDTFLLTKVLGVEAISQPFKFKLTLISQNPSKNNERSFIQSG